MDETPLHWVIDFSFVSDPESFTQQEGAPTLVIPFTDLTLPEVVRIQIEALQHNANPYTDAGIPLTFSFASPSNRRNTGPVTVLLT